MSLAKRSFDLFWSALGLLLLSPVILIIALWVKLHDGGAVFFRQERVGLHGKPFRIWKFRTMVVNAEGLGAQLTVGRDPRITPIGHFLRKTKLDELPQLINVWVGEMSLVGPRPEVPRYVALYTPEQRKVLSLKPGITDLASVKYHDENTLLGRALDPERYYVETVMPEKLLINLEYATQSSVWADFWVILQTVFSLLR